jgi:hypothetical protein
MQENQKETGAGYLTVRYKKIERDIKTSVKIMNVYSDKIIKTNGIWDTGATSSVITKSIVEHLGLIPIGDTLVKGVHGEKIAFRYPIKIQLLEDEYKFAITIIATECDELSADGNVGMLIGMDVIGKGDFAVTNFQGITAMSFRIPSLQTIDFIDDVI